jgi:PP-loop superfamily ATP-utilizing enzyme
MADSAEDSVEAITIMGQDLEEAMEEASAEVE